MASSEWVMGTRRPLTLCKIDKGGVALETSAESEALKSSASVGGEA